MNKVIDFIKKYKAEIIIILTGASSLFISISQLGGTVGNCMWCCCSNHSNHCIFSKGWI